jgi:hypothetical protein
MLRTLFLSAAMLIAAPAFANPLGAEVLLVVPNHSGSVPAELKSMRSALQSKGYSGATVTARRSVQLEKGQTRHVQLGAESLDLTLTSVSNGKANVVVAHEGHSERSTTVSVVNTRFLITVPPKKR